MATRNVKLKYGTMAQYEALANKNAETLYFITDRGIVYKGDLLVTNKIRVSQETVGTSGTYTIHIDDYSQGSGQLPYTRYTINGVTPAALSVVDQTLNRHRLVKPAEGDPDDPDYQPAIYADGQASGTNFGHVKLSDAADAALDANSGTAATPKAVATAISTAMGNLNGAMVLKGTVGDAPLFRDTLTYAVGDFCTRPEDPNVLPTPYLLYRCVNAIDRPGAWDSADWSQVPRDAEALPTSNVEVGHTWRVVAPGTYAGHQCEPGDEIVCVKVSNHTITWTVVQANLVGAVTHNPSSPLGTGSLVRGAGGDAVEAVEGNKGQSVRFYGRYDSGGRLVGTDVRPTTFGGTTYGICEADPNNYLKSVAIGTPNGALETDFIPVHGAMLSVFFAGDVDSKAHLEQKPAMLAVGTNPADGEPYTAPIVHRMVTQGEPGVFLEGGVIHSGDTATFVYDTQHAVEIGGITYDACWRLVAVDYKLATVAFTGNYASLAGVPTLLSQFTNNIIRYGVCTTAASTAAKVASISGFALVAGGIVAITFSHDVPASATLNVSSTGAKPIWFKGAAVGEGDITAGDTATLMYDGTNWVLLAIDQSRLVWESIVVS